MVKGKGLLLLICSAYILETIYAADKIEHIIVLMMENRSFDHIMGFKKGNNSEIDGCLPNAKGCSNPMDPQDPNSPQVTVSADAAEHQISDPDHSFPATLDQVYGYGPDTQVPPPMSGFIKNYAHKEIIMQCFPPDLVPAMSTLADEFAIFDHWYASVPGPTEVNRLYVFSATSDGSAANDDVRLALGYPQRSVFRNIDESIYNRTWGVYFAEAPSAFFLKDTRTEENLLKFHDIRKFYTDVAAGTLPSYSFIEPRYFEIPDIPANDQHPDHDVGEGDRLMKSLYEALRASPLWTKSLFLITYDEHGGFFDHVGPPTGVPSPDGKVSHDTTPSFDFTRLGVRVPAIAISPWIKKGTVIHDPVNGTFYEHSSVVATVRKMLVPDQPFLTKRDAWAQTFEWLVDTVDAVRTDCPTTLPEAPIQRDHVPSFLPARDQMGQNTVTDLHRSFISMASALNNEGMITEDGHGMTEEQGAHFMKEKINQFLKREVVSF
jgi:phospholipase C